MAKGHDDFVIGPAYPSLSEIGAQAGTASGHYFHQDLHIAQQIQAAQPTRHIDVGSRIDGFVAHVASFRPIEVFDIRALSGGIPNVTFTERDITNEDASFDAITDSLSSLHAVEHFGLGRYGDTVDYYGYRKGFDNLSRMVKPGGRFYFSVPIGQTQRVEFDGHRVFSIPYLLRDMIEPTFAVEHFAWVDDRGEMHRDGDVRSVDANRTFGLQYGCGIFTLRKQ